MDSALLLRTVNPRHHTENLLLRTMNHLTANPLPYTTHRHPPTASLLTKSRQQNLTVRRPHPTVPLRHPMTSLLLRTMNHHMKNHHTRNLLQNILRQPRRRLSLILLQSLRHTVNHPHLTLDQQHHTVDQLLRLNQKQLKLTVNLLSHIILHLPHIANL